MNPLTDILTPFAKDVKKSLLDTLFPTFCLACENEGGEYLCGTCANLLEKSKPGCLICHKTSVFGLTHPHCKIRAYPEGLITTFSYKDDRVAKLIIVGKYYSVSSIYKTFARLMCQSLPFTPKDLAGENFLLTPTPLHWMRKKWRGFNQSEVLCEELSKHLQLNILSCLERTKFTRTQKNLKREERLKNMEAAFKLKADTHISGQNFILVDDVVTTGSTMLEAAKILKTNGAAKVWCLAVARD